MALQRTIAALIGCTMTALAFSPLSLAQEAEKSATEQRSKHYWVTEGLLDLKFGTAIDLTDRKILVLIEESERERAQRYKTINIMINGKTYAGLKQGQRLDLTQFRHTKDTLKDMSECYLDLLDVSVPKGSPAVAHLRFVCH